MRTQTQNHLQPGQHIWQENPLLVQLLGLSPLLAISHSAITGISLGLVTATVCLVGTLIHVQFRQKISDDWRFVWYLFITSVLTSLIGILFQLKLLALHRELGIYLALVASNFAVLIYFERVDASLRDPNQKFSFPATLYHCVGIVLAMSLFSSLREILGFGTLFHNLDLILSEGSHNLFDSQASNTGELFAFSLSQPGAYILLGFLIALGQFFKIKYRIKQNANTEKITKVPRARVTGKI